MKVRLLVLTLVLVAFGGGQAWATSPQISLSEDGLASEPGVAVAADGTAHIAWQVNLAGPDELRYCRLPRGATTCDKTSTFVPDTLGSFGAPDVLLNGAGRVQLIVNRCCPGISARLTLVESVDNGATFKPPKVIGSDDSGLSISGPGPNAITAAGGGSPGGVTVQVAPTDAMSQVTQEAGLAEGPSQYYPGGVGLIDAATPITAYTDLENTFYRQFDATKGTAYNNAANWLPGRTIPSENEPTIVSGAAGTYIMTHDELNANALQDFYQVRRVAPDTGAVGAPVLASDIGPPIFGKLTADASGGLTSTWTEAGEFAPIRSAVAPTGGSFNRPGTLVANARAFNMKIAISPDRGGVVVWDENTAGKIRVAQIPPGGVVSDPAPPAPPAPPGPPGPPKPNIPGQPTPQDALPGDSADCKRELIVRQGVQATVRGQGCFKNIGGKTWVSSADFVLNGIDFITPGAATVQIDGGTHKLKAPAGTVQKAGSIILAKDAVDWDLDGETPFKGLEKSGIKLFDFKVFGEAGVKFIDGAAKIRANLALPDPFDVVTAETVLTTTSKTGLVLDGVSLNVKNATIGPLTISKLDLSFDQNLSRFKGAADVVLPLSDDELKADFIFQDGRLVELAAEYKGKPLPFPLGGGLSLNVVSFKYSSEDGFTLAGGAEVSFPSFTGPRFILDALTGSAGGGGLTFNIPKGADGQLQQRAIFTLGAKFKVNFGFELDIGGFTATLDTLGPTLTFDGNVDIGNSVVGINGSAKGGLHIPSGDFYVSTELEACLVLCANMGAVISNVGVAGCADLYFFQVLVGVKWKDGFDVGSSCTFGPYIPARFAGGKAPKNGAGPDLTLKGGNVVDVGTYYVGEKARRTVAFEIKGNGGVPSIVIKQGKEDLIATDPANVLTPVASTNGEIIVSPNASSNSVRVLISQERFGKGITGELSIFRNGGAPVNFESRSAGFGDSGPNARAAQSSMGISVAEDYGDAKVTARLGGKGRRRTLGYRTTNVAGGSKRSVEFVENASNGVVQVLGRTKKGVGAIPFRIFDGPAGRRRIDAVVRNYAGMAISRKTVLTYVAPGPELPGRPTRLKLKRTGSRLRITWRGTKGARRHLVEIAVADGRRLRLMPSKRAVVIPRVAKRERVKVTVRGLTKLGRRGPALSARR